MWFEQQELDLDLNRIPQLAARLEPAISNNFGQLQSNKYGGSVTTAAFAHYNLATVFDQQFHRLFTSLQQLFRHAVPTGALYERSLDF